MVSDRDYLEPAIFVQGRSHSQWNRVPKSGSLYAVMFKNRGKVSVYYNQKTYGKSHSSVEPKKLLLVSKGGGGGGALENPQMFHLWDRKKVTLFPPLCF